MNIYIIRHGETETNRKKLFHGKHNIPLNANGIEQVKTAGEYFACNNIQFDAAYSSPFIRAIETAKIITGEGITVRVDDRLRKMDYDGDEEESHASIEERVGDFLENLRSAEHRNVLISTHVTALQGALEYLTPESNGAYWSMWIENCTVYSFSCTGGKYDVPRQAYAL